MIEESLVAALKTAWADLEVFPVSVPEGQQPPFVTYREVDHSDESITFEIDAAAISGLTTEGYRQSKLLAAAIDAALENGFAYTGGCVTETDVVKRSDEYDTVVPLHWTRSQFRLLLNVDSY